MSRRNELEPPGLVAHFLAHPPQGFAAFEFPGCGPGFHAVFDLLTTADPATLRTVAALPGSGWWRRLLRLPTVFFGTTVSEYLLPDAALAAAELPAALIAHWRRRTLLLIAKDIPEPSPLLSPEEGAAATAFVAACRAQGFILVEGQALAYVPIDFPSVEAYLGRLSAGRRKDMRRKLRARAGLRVDVLATGAAALADPRLLAELYRLYEAVYAQSEIHFDKLSAGFFNGVFGDAALDGRVFLYYAGEELIGFNLCFIHRGMLIDKYVGFRYPAARAHNLYFVSWMENLAYALEQGLSHYVAGWTDPQIKADLGARFTFTRHAVYVRNGWLRRVLARISGRFEHDRSWFAEQARGPAPGP